MRLLADVLRSVASAGIETLWRSSRLFRGGLGEDVYCVWDFEEWHGDWWEVWVWCGRGRLFYRGFVFIVDGASLTAASVLLAQAALVTFRYVIDPLPHRFAVMRPSRPPRQRPPRLAVVCVVQVCCTTWWSGH
jgi:hypothetical protein